ncbi:DTW domain-containing protein [Undibacterium sp. Jales W-56]|uniref:tRNA-uridine aminocarboxypropyltransferase n=1 Tax=Undibacterium sp. Jales W-56 TaxID=2897325 RepID=UPI0021D16EE9|nr:tRNA-uridine aminocarboxypropyltransferase [Undibacterium sp. Jales W-56]MCU6432718.1 DTW domain-containing protein [Undibacterium sp. Jales W-56]
MQNPDIDLPRPAKRHICEQCLRPQTVCICPWVTPIASEIEVVVLQHPLEVQHAKGSARLLHLSLPGSQMHVGEVFDETWLEACLHADGRRSILLYPDTPQDALLGLLSAPPLECVAADRPGSLRLIVLDGTWRKSRKMLYLNRLLQGLPRVSLRDIGASHYRIRKAHKPDQLSTLEATCYALMQLDRMHENSGEKYQALLSAFDRFIAQQEAIQAAHRKI